MVDASLDNIADPMQFQKQFFAGRDELLHMTMLFEHLPSTYFFAKDAKSRFVRMNRVNLELYGLEDERHLLGKTDRDFHPPALAEAYIAEDNRVMESQQPILEQSWLVPFVDGRLKWFVSTKMPLTDSSGDPIGIVGVMYAIATPEEQLARLKRIAPAIRYLDQNFARSTSLASIAERCEISLTHFNRLFQEIMHMSPSQYRNALRIERARHLLKTTTDSLTSIATAAGFCDQSHFTKQFKKSIGMTPKQYRGTLSSPSN